jgi:hypothetical protein
VAGFAHATCAAPDSRSTSAGVSLRVAAGRICSSCSVVRALPNRGDDPSLGEQPGERDGGHRPIVGRRDLVERLEHRRAPIVKVSTAASARSDLTASAPGRYLPVRKPLASAK